ncbi:hypothetical protein EBT16_07015 [bacterium]|nr:hypothetical protein [bacterium]
MSQKLENYYQVLRVKKDASSTDIIAAYHAAKSAFSHQNAAASLSLSNEEISSYLTRIEEAYLTLTDPKKRHDYDSVLNLAQSTASHSPSSSNSVYLVNGEMLRRTRERLNISLEELFRITRIPIHYLRAIEEETVENMPARVYLQGFVKNLAQVYKLNPQETARLFLEYYDKTLSQRANT